MDYVKLFETSNEMVELDYPSLYLIKDINEVGVYIPQYVFYATFDDGTTQDGLIDSEWTQEWVRNFDFNRSEEIDEFVIWVDSEYDNEPCDIENVSSGPWLGGIDSTQFIKWTRYKYSDTYIRHQFIIKPKSFFEYFDTLNASCGSFYIWIKQSGSGKSIFINFHMNDDTVENTEEVSTFGLRRSGETINLEITEDINC